MRQYLMKTGILATLCLGLATTLPTIQAEATSNVELLGGGNRAIYGGNYWKTSNLREWANTDATTVHYTNAPPTPSGTSAPYDKEPGFLSTFTQQERDGIAITEHRVYLSTEDSLKVGNGGNGQIDSNEYRGESVKFNLPLVDDSETRYHQKVNDKVFLLNSFQLQRFIEKRGFPLLKSLTPEAKLKNNRTEDKTSWWINAPSTNIGYDQNQQVSTNINDVITTTQPRYGSGFVPAMHLKANTIVNSKSAKTLSIGEVVSYGRYLGKPIEWRVVNRTSTGDPLLVSERVLDVKGYDAYGDDFSYSESLSVRWDTPDVLMKESDKDVPYDGQTDTKEPAFKVLNDDALFKRSNASFTLELEASDADSGVMSVELPNGVVLNQTKFSYNVFENKEYVFKAKDRAGNVKVFTVPVSNINPESSVVIRPSVEGWTNQNVFVDITATNSNVGFENKTYDQGGRDATPYVYPNFTSYTDKRIRISGSYELTKATASTNNITVGTGFYYRSSYKKGDDYFLVNRWQRPVNITLNELANSGKTPFDLTYTIPGDYFENLQAWSQISVNGNIRDYTVRFENVSYELLDKDDFGISKIILPNGQEVSSNSYRDTLTKDGIYPYRVLDNRGKTTERTVEVKIDKTLPTIQVTPSITGWTNQPYTLNIKASDELSGAKEIVLPNGQTVSGKEFNYLVNNNGTYSFTAVDVAGNRKTLTYTVNNFDFNAPSLSVMQNEANWTNQNIVLQVSASDKETSVDAIQLPNSTWIKGNKAIYEVSANGEYRFSARDTFGNTMSTLYKVTNIDKTLPELFVGVTQKLLDGSIKVNIKAQDR